MIQNSRNKGKIIGLTGGIATGKTTVSKYLLEKGFIVIDADTLARKVVEVGKPAYIDIVKEFGEDILNYDLTINRAKLGEIVFSDKELREKLNKIVHPRVTEEMKLLTQNAQKKGRIVFLDIPLLIEALDTLKSEGLAFDEIWLVYADDKTQLKRLMNRDNLSEQQAYNRINAQMPIEDKIKYADIIIDNTGDINSLKEKIDRLLEEY